MFVFISKMNEIIITFNGNFGCHMGLNNPNLIINTHNVVHGVSYCVYVLIIMLR